MNHIVTIGRLTKDPELRYTPNGVAVGSFTVAVDRPFNSAKGEREADFIPVVVWQKLAENCANHLKKGRLVAVEGRLQIRTYEKDGQNRRIAEVVAGEVKFLDSGKKSEKPEQQASVEPDVSGIDLDQLPF